MGRILIALLLLFSFQGESQTKGRYAQQNHFMSFWASTTYSIEDKQVGYNLKGSYVIDNIMHLNLQGTYFHPMGTESYTEFRAEGGVYAFILPHQNFTPFVYVGLNYGMWKRNWNIPDEVIPPSFRVDESYSLGGGLALSVGKHRITLEHRYQPEIYRNYTSLGFEFRIFEPKGGFKLRKYRGGL